MKSLFQKYHSDRIVEMLETYADFGFIEEMQIDRGRVDLGTLNKKYGIEIKSSVCDLKSGQGLNQNKFEFGYVMAPLNIACQAIGYLYMRGMENTGFIGITSDDKYTLVKPAVANIRIAKDSSVFDTLIGRSDQICNCFYDHDGIYERI